MSRICFALLALSVAACSGGGSTDIEGTLRFADRSDVEISRLINAASGSEGFQAQATAESYADPSEPDDPCPARSLTGNVGTITGGCTTQDGVTLEGTIAIKNPLNWCLVFDESVGWCDAEYEANWNEPTEYTFSGFAITQGGFTRSFDGRLTSASVDGYIDMDITSVQLDVAVRSDIYAERDGSQEVDINGSGVELVGVGGALVDGHIGISSTNQTSGSFTLDGADTLQVTMEGSCIRWQIEGTERMYSTCP
jgi:hypothetical protein